MHSGPTVEVFDSMHWHVDTTETTQLELVGTDEGLACEYKEQISRMIVVT